ncbi:Adenomatous polyposis coli tumor suppressor family protein [Acanthocheilonema viteae]
MGLNGMRSIANTYNVTNRNWNRNEMNSKNNDNVIMRPKKLKDVQEKQQQRLIRYRPVSTANSYASSLASSGMTDIRWRNSRASPCSSLSTSCQHIHESPNLWKYEGYLEEEKALINRGLETAKRLTGWYCERLKSVQKRSSLLDRGLVPVDGAVHEEKLNYLRAHIAELNRRITSLIESNDHSFPTHSNLQVKTQMPQPSDDHSQYYRRQNIKLCQELADKNLLIERLLSEKTENNKEHGSAFRKVEPKRLTSTITNTERKNHHAQSHSWIPSEGTLM